ncbi:MAG TPA: site-2 protease family protein [Pyrinomonadaceae bacterium]|jgi:membrane-associated protease RseP (regulator of RpoE activity)
MSESIRAVETFVTTSHEPFIGRRVVATRPTTREWVRHVALFLLTALTATFAGIMQAIDANAIAEPTMHAPVSLLDHVLYLPVYYAQAVGSMLAYAVAHPFVIGQGATFAAALLTILLAHEAGHYIACRRYGVDATLPFFLPAPPPFLPGTFGAFIKIKSPIPTRRALFDIGVAGPLAGFVALLPVAVAAVVTAQPAPPLPADASVIYFNDPLLLRLVAHALDVDLSNVATNPFYFAAWIGLLVTSLNLLPVGQLDGGHATYAVFGAGAHKWVGRVAFSTMLALAVLGWLWHSAPGGFIYALLLFIMLRVRHPNAEDESQAMGRTRTVVAALTLIVFILSFMPFPITVK